MKYKNAAGIFPPELLETIQQYVQGEYIYIPIKEKIENSASTDYEVELQKRNAHIYTKSLEGMSNKKLAEVYSLSESSIRRIIINQRKGYELMEGRIKNVLNNWDVTCGKVTQIYKTAWQVGEEYILKVYDEPQKLDRNIKISTILDDLGIPVGKIIPTKEKATFTSDEQYYYVLTERLCGSNIVNLKDYPNIAFEMGKIIANLHVAFKECETQEKFWNNSLLDEMKGWIRSTLNEGGWKYVDAEKFSVIVAQLEALYENLPVQLIHRDVHFGNFLFHEGQFSGYIDFDLSQRNIRIFDLCYFMLGLLSEEGKMEITGEEWFEILQDVFKGYRQRIKLSEEEKEAVPYVMMAIEILFVAWFSKQEDWKCVENAVKIFEFVERNAEKIVCAIEHW